MNMQETARFILGLRSAGWSEKEINDFMLYIESGELQYMPKADNETTAETDWFDRIAYITNPMSEHGVIFLCKVRLWIYGTFCQHHLQFFSWFLAVNGHSIPLVLFYRPCCIPQTVYL